MGTILWESTPKARKLHLCSCCGRFINRGEEYDRARILGDDGPYTWKQCAHCCAFMWLYVGDIAYDLHEGYTTEDIQEWEPATPEAREHKRRWAVGWRHGGDLYPVPEIVQ